MWIGANAIQGSGNSDANTDSDGWYTIRGVAPGTYTIKAHADGEGYVQQYYAGGHTSTNAGLVTVTGADAIKGIDLVMTRGAAIFGRITDAATGQPISGMNLSARPIGDDQMAWASTNTNGTFALRALPDGVVGVIVQGQGYLEVRKTVTIVDGEDVTDFNF